MYLKKLELAGFKSFGGRIVVSPGPHIVGVVGPNGSGKSNIADAVRWVLGEQSNKLLRMTKSEDIIFAGTDKKPKSSMAEVILTLDNHDGAMPLDWEEVEISRRLYRSGDSEYLLNGKRTKLSDLHEILAQSGFGQNSYSVIGQGMIDRLIISTPAERKLLFDDASGIRRYELRRDSDRKKLTQAQENIIALEITLAELRPQYKQAAAEADRLNARNQLETDLLSARAHYIHASTQENDEQTKRLSVRLAAKQKELSRLENEIATLKKQRTEEQKNRESIYEDHNQMLAEIQQLTTERTTLGDALARLRASSELQDTARQLEGDKDSQHAKLSRELRDGAKSLGLLQAKLEKTQSVVAGFETSIQVINADLKSLNATLGEHRREIGRGQKREYLNHAMGLLNLLARGDNIATMEKKDRDLALHKLRRMLRLAIEDRSDILTGEIAKLQNKITRLMGRREDLVEQQNRDIIRERSIELDIGFLEDHLADLRKEAKTLGNTTNGQDMASSRATKTEISRLTKQIKGVESRIDVLQSKLKVSSPKEHDSLAELESKLDARADQRLTIGNEVSQLTQQLAALQFKSSELIDKQQLWFGATQIPSTTPVRRLDSRRTVKLEQILELEAELRMSSELNNTSKILAADLQSRIAELEHQKEDLGQAKADIEKLLGDLDRKIRDTFTKQFSNINKHFNSFAAKLFDGGHAELLLSTDESGTYGIDIVASPKGKRLTQLSALSGGERALAGIALLAAIMAVNPSPFVILDEVDAALDEANSLKYADILRHIARHTQLIVITHNHETMKVADQLIGITSGVDGSAIAISAGLEQFDTARLRS